MANRIYIQSDERSPCIVLVAFANLDRYLHVPNSKSKTLKKVLEFTADVSVKEIQ